MTDVTQKGETDGDETHVRLEIGHSGPHHACHSGPGRRSGPALRGIGAETMIAVTIESLPGFEIKRVLGEVVGAAARPDNVFTEGVKALPGSNGARSTQTLNRGREEAIARMVRTARQLGANAVVGMRFDHRTIGSSWTEVCAYGTAVFVVPNAR